jgi:hypothetical protein
MARSAMNSIRNTFSAQRYNPLTPQTTGSRLANQTTGFSDTQPLLEGAQPSALRQAMYTAPSANAMREHAGGAIRNFISKVQGRDQRGYKQLDFTKEPYLPEVNADFAPGQRGMTGLGKSMMQANSLSGLSRSSSVSSLRPLAPQSTGLSQTSSLPSYRSNPVEPQSTGGSAPTYRSNPIEPQATGSSASLVEGVNPLGTQANNIINEAGKKMGAEKSTRKGVQRAANFTLALLGSGIGNVVADAIGRSGQPTTATTPAPLPADQPAPDDQPSDEKPKKKGKKKSDNGATQQPTPQPTQSAPANPTTQAPIPQAPAPAPAISGGRF